MKQSSTKPIERAADPFNPIEYPELVFGLVGPIGTDMQLVERVLEKELQKVYYKSVKIHVSDLFSEVPTEVDLVSTPIEKRYESRIKAGNKIRQLIDRKDALALLAVSKIRTERELITGDRKVPAEQVAYILNQLKRPEEVQAFRRIYGRGFIQISAHCPEESRVKSLVRAISKSHFGQHDDGYYEGAAHQLIRTDEAQEEEPFGQRLRDTYHLADVFIDASSERDAQRTCERFVKALFGYPFITPTKDEYGQYLAKVASLRSADLSRQVGAVIAREDGSVMSMGCNEVPKAGGGTYWEHDPGDHRDFVEGEDSGARQKDEIISDVLRRLQEAKWLRPELNSADTSKLSEQASGAGNPLKETAPLADALVTNILEFGRIIHAEMNAITDAARHGLATRDSTLFSTTFPCHICARHIVAAGIKRVVYIEPYPKSYALKLYGDSISVDAAAPKGKVKFEPFVGIAPERYAEIFTKGRRKDKRGNAIDWSPIGAKPTLIRTLPAYVLLENSAVNTFAEIVEALPQKKKPKAKGAPRTTAKKSTHPRKRSNWPNGVKARRRVTKP